jgi:hypothetical protein
VQARALGDVRRITKLERKDPTMHWPSIWNVLRANGLPEIRDEVRKKLQEEIYFQLYGSDASHEAQMDLLTEELADVTSQIHEMEWEASFGETDVEGLFSAQTRQNELCASLGDRGKPALEKGLQRFADRFPEPEREVILHGTPEQREALEDKYRPFK